MAEGLTQRLAHCIALPPMANPVPPRPSTRLYLITPPKLGPSFAKDLAAALDAGDVAQVMRRMDQQWIESTK